MNGLADIVLDYLLVWMFHGESNIDPDFACKQMEVYPELIKGLTKEERVALSASARRRLAEIAAPPDEYGYKPRTDKNVIEFLEVPASGDLYEQWCK
jgi:hypothetical protein